MYYERNNFLSSTECVCDVERYFAVSLIFRMKLQFSFGLQSQVLQYFNDTKCPVLA